VCDSRLALADIDSSGDYDDVREVLAVRGGVSDAGGRVLSTDDPYHYIDIDRLTASSDG